MFKGGRFYRFWFIFQPLHTVVCFCVFSSCCPPLLAAKEKEGRVCRALGLAQARCVRVSMRACARRTLALRSGRIEIRTQLLLKVTVCQPKLF